MPYNSSKQFKYVVKAYTLIKGNNKNSEGEILKELNTFVDKIPINRKIQTIGTTLLNLAIYYECYEIVKLLIDNGADVSLKNDNDYYKPIIYNLNKYNIPLTNLLLKNSKTPKDDLVQIINHCFKFNYSKMLIYAINELYLLQKRDINYILNIKQEPKINSAPERYKRIYNYPTLCLEFNPLYCKYYPPETRERIIFIIWIMQKTNIVLPLELVFLTLKQISLVEL